MNVFDHLRKYGDDQEFIPNDSIPNPTTALPGTEDKIAVMEERVWRGEELFQAGDETVLADDTERAWENLRDLIRYKIGTGRKGRSGAP